MHLMLSVHLLLLRSHQGEGARLFISFPLCSILPCLTSHHLSFLSHLLSTNNHCSLYSSSHLGFAPAQLQPCSPLSQSLFPALLAPRTTFPAASFWSLRNDQLCSVFSSLCSFGLVTQISPCFFSSFLVTPCASSSIENYSVSSVSSLLKLSFTRLPARRHE